MGRVTIVVVVLFLFVSWAAGAQQLPASLLSGLLYEEPNERLQQLAKLSDDYSSITRTYFSQAHQRAAQQIASWMRQAGLRAWVDNIGNVRGRVEGKNKDAPVILIGSHYDTVIDGGKYDGALGVITAISAVKALLLQAALTAGVLSMDHVLSTGRKSVSALMDIEEVGQLLPTPIEIIAFADEEGVRFQTTFLGSTAIAGTLATSGGWKAVDADGKTVADVLKEDGYPGTLKSIKAIAMKREQVAEYIEVHIEQGPQLESVNRPLAVVDGIAGQERVLVMMHGAQGHAGTVPMRLRKDTLAAAAKEIYDIEQTCLGKDPKLPVDDTLVCTVGAVDIWPGASNVIPGAVNFTVDVRSREDDVRGGIVHYIIDSVSALCKERGLKCDVLQKHSAATVNCEPDILEGMKEAIVSAEKMAPVLQHYAKCMDRTEHNQVACDRTIETTQLTEAYEFSCGNAAAAETGSCNARAAELAASVPVLVSGAGHDAMAMAALTKVGMMFVRCDGGISHSSLEHVEPSDIGAATAAVFMYLKNKQGM